MSHDNISLARRTVVLPSDLYQACSRLARLDGVVLQPWVCLRLQDVVSERSAELSYDKR